MTAPFGGFLGPALGSGLLVDPFLGPRDKKTGVNRRTHFSPNLERAEWRVVGQGIDDQRAAETEGQEQRRLNSLRVHTQLYRPHQQTLASKGRRG